MKVGSKVEKLNLINNCNIKTLTLNIIHDTSYRADSECKIVDDSGRQYGTRYSENTAIQIKIMLEATYNTGFAHGLAHSFLSQQKVIENDLKDALSDKMNT